MSDHLTSKQRQILDVIIKGNPDGTWVDLNELLERLPYETTKDSLQFSIRALQTKGLLEKKDMEMRRGQPRRVLAPTAQTYAARRT
jgi:hypothetical protein